ncbi:CHCH domain-containing protein [Colletotrichum tabaci]|uniref:CHCH domain-containing protein n=1 Tax=Colletotrichum tabaci TaxID=1209068 RepID=A0AAV9T294_9PEZI
MSKQESDAARKSAVDDDEPDDWDKRIFNENAKLTDCYFEKKDWRQCTAEMERFKSCWKQQGNDQRTDMKDA